MAVADRREGRYSGHKTPNVTAGSNPSYRAGTRGDARVAHHDPQRPTPGHRGDRVELPDDQGATAVGLHDLDLQAIDRGDLVGQAERHAVTLRTDGRDF